MCKILIEIEGGGIIKTATNTKGVEIIVVDRDNFDYEENMGLVSCYEPDTILPGGEKFSTQYGKSSDDQDKEIYEILKNSDL